MTIFSDSMLLGAGGDETSAFIGISPIYSAGGVNPWPTGTQSGDIACFVGVGLSDGSVPGFTPVPGDAFSHGQTSFAYRVLNSGDISSPPSVAGPSFGDYRIVIYRGPTVLTKKSNAQSSSASVVVSGFTKSGSSKFVLGVAFDREDSGTLPAAPSGFTSRGSGRSTYYADGIYDVASALYGEGSVTFGLIAGAYGGSGTLLELT